jgi:hypothetical protein
VAGYRTQRTSKQVRTRFMEADWVCIQDKHFEGEETYGHLNENCVEMGNNSRQIRPLVQKARKTGRNLWKNEESQIVDDGTMHKRENARQMRNEMRWTAKKQWLQTIRVYQCFDGECIQEFVKKREKEIASSTSHRIQSFLPEWERLFTTNKETYLLRMNLW